MNFSKTSAFKKAGLSLCVSLACGSLSFPAAAQSSIEEIEIKAHSGLRIPKMAVSMGSRKPMAWR